MMYLSQIIMLYTLNLCSVVCQLYRNKTGRKKANDNSNNNKGPDSKYFTFCGLHPPKKDECYWNHNAEIKLKFT